MTQETQAQAVEVLLVELAAPYVARLVVDFAASPPVIVAASVEVDAEAEPVAIEAEPQPEPVAEPEPVAIEPQPEPVAQAEPQPVASEHADEAAAVSVPAATLSRAFSRFAKIVKKKARRPILSGVRLAIDGGTLFIDATDGGDVELSEAVDGFGATGTAEAVASLASLQAALKSQGRGATVRVAILQSGAVRVSRVTVPALGDVAEYPRPTEHGDGFAAVKLTAEDIAAALAATLPAADVESSRYALSGVYLELAAVGLSAGSESLLAVATDGRRLHTFQVGAELSDDTAAAILPSAAARLALDCAKLATSATVELVAKPRPVAEPQPVAESQHGDEAEANEAEPQPEPLPVAAAIVVRFFAADGRELRSVASRPVEGRYPRFRDAFPSRTRGAGTLATVDAESFATLAADALPVVKLADSEARSVDFTLTGESLTASVEKVGFSASIVAVDYIGEPFKQSFDGRYMADATKAAAAAGSLVDIVGDATSEAATACELRAGRFRAVVMPLTKPKRRQPEPQPEAATV
jgi:DNA polymerase III sliding clamp (beta) subunit (PCNA family)